MSYEYVLLRRRRTSIGFFLYVYLSFSRFYLQMLHIAWLVVPGQSTNSTGWQRTGAAFDTTRRKQYNASLLSDTDGYPDLNLVR
jgi:hypothetical protein